MLNRKSEHGTRNQTLADAGRVRTARRRPLAVRRDGSAARRSDRAIGLPALGPQPASASAEGAARHLRSLGTARTDGDDLAAAADALRLLRFPAGVIPDYLAGAGRSEPCNARCRS